MGVRHARRELEALIHTVGLLLLHAHGIVLGLGVLLSIGLVHGDLTDDFLSKVLKHGVEEQLDVLTRLGRLGLNVLCDLNALVLLSLRKLINLLYISGLAGVNEAEC